jgi:hypothetical protein
VDRSQGRRGKGSRDRSQTRKGNLARRARGKTDKKVRSRSLARGRKAKEKVRARVKARVREKVKERAKGKVKGRERPRVKEKAKVARVRAKGKVKDAVISSVASGREISAWAMVVSVRVVSAAATCATSAAPVRATWRCSDH